MRDAFVRALTALAVADDRVMLLTGDLGFGVLDDFSARFPRQYLNVGVAEQNLASLATGLALEGRTVFTYSIGNFPTLRCLEQLRNGACYHDAAVITVAVGGGFSYGSLGMSHHATEDLAVLRALPGMCVVSPGDDWEAAQATHALAARGGPGYLRLDRTATATPLKPTETFALGEPRVLRDGADVTVAATGGVVQEALRAADALAVRGVATRVVSVHTLSKHDPAALLRALGAPRRLVVVEEHQRAGGLGGVIAEAAMALGVALPRVAHLAVEGFPELVGTQAFMRAQAGLDAAAIERAALG